MAGDSMKCPHCECKVKVSEVEKDDGYCPECGQLLMASSLAGDFDNDYDLDDDEMESMDGEYEDDDMGEDDEEGERDILDELTDMDDFDFDEEDFDFDADEPSQSPAKRSSGRGKGRSRSK